jgi:ABC-2 type transport system ATP-binding protein
VLDEPTNGVDPVSRRDFWQLLYELHREGTTIVISSSYMDEAERASHFALLRSGRLIECGVPQKTQREFAATIYELTVDNPRQVRSLLVEGRFFEEVHLFGRQLHLTIDRPVTVAEIRSMLNHQQIDSSSLRQITPTFEDIFLHLSRTST